MVDRTGAEQFVRMAMYRCMLLTALNDNAAITYWLPRSRFSDSLKYAVVAGAVAGGGLTVDCLMLRTRRSINSGLSIRDEGSQR